MSEKVRAHVLARIPEFCRLNGVVMNNGQMDNLSYWALSVIPSRVMKDSCSPSGEVIACACIGFCQVWREYPEKP